MSSAIEISIRDGKASMTRSERIIADYIEPRLDEITGLSLDELAGQIKTSKASIVRFCKTLGFRGYRDFVLKLSEEAGYRRSDSEKKRYTDIRPGDATGTIVDNVCFANTQSITDTRAILSIQTLDDVVSMIESSRRIFFFGIGASGLVCMDASQKFMRINKQVWALTDSHSMKQAASLLDRNDAAIFISYSGTTAEVVSALKIARPTGARTVAITKYMKNNIGALCDKALYISSPEVSIRSGAMGSRIAMLNVIDIIFSVYASRHYNDIEQYLDRSHDVLSSVTPD